MLIVFQSTWDSQLGRIGVAEPFTELVGRETQVVRMASYRPDPKTKQFEIDGIEEMLAQKFIELANME